MLFKTTRNTVGKSQRATKRKNQDTLCVHDFHEPEVSERYQKKDMF